MKNANNFNNCRPYKRAIEILSSGHSIYTCKWSSYKFDTMIQTTLRTKRSLGYTPNSWQLNTLNDALVYPTSNVVMKH